MNLRCFFCLFLFQILIFSRAGYSQNSISDSLTDPYFTDLKNQLPPLENLIQLAVKNSPFLKLSEALVDKSEAQAKVVRREWQSSISAAGNYSVGNQRFLVAGPDQGYQNNFLNGYRASLNLSLPLTVITTRGQRIKAAEADVRATEFQLQQNEVDLKNRVVQEYYELIAASNVFQIKSLAREGAELQNEIAEKKFSEGGMSLEEYTNIGRSVTSAFVDYEVARSSFNIKYKQFEQLLGVSIENLRKRK